MNQECLGYVHSIGDADAAVVYINDRKTYLPKRLLEPMGLWRKGAHFSIRSTGSDEVLWGFSINAVITPRPALEDNEFRRAAQEIDLGFFEDAEGLGGQSKP